MTCTINGYEYEMLNDFSIERKAGNKTSSSVKVLVGEGQAVPQANDVIEINDDSFARIFWGICGIPTSPTYSTGNEKKIYSIVCSGAERILSNRIVNVAYQGYTVTQIVQALYNTYISEENIRLGTISNIDVIIEVYTAQNLDLQTALNELADLVGATWKIDMAKRFSFLTIDEFPSLPVEINEQFLFGTALQKKQKNNNVRTVQYISGATAQTATQTETFTYTSGTDVIMTSFPISSKPTIYINNVQVDESRIGVRGFDSGDENLLFLWSYNSSEISVQEGLFSGDVIKVVYIGLFPIRYVGYNNTKIAELAQKTGLSGKIENVQVSNDVSTLSDATQLADSLLKEYSSNLNEVSFWLESKQWDALGYGLHSYFFDLLTKVTFNLPKFDIVGDYVVVEKRITYIAENNYKLAYTLRDRNFLKSYGETISKLRRDINQLDIRKDEVITSQNTVTETKALSEEVEVNISVPFFPQAQVMNGSVMAMMTLDESYYPCAESTGAITGQYYFGLVGYPDGSAGSIFAPVQLMDTYPITVFIVGLSYYPSTSESIFEPLYLGEFIYPV